MAFLFWSSLLMFFLRLWLSLYGGIHPDEAYYWVWAQKLHLGYYDHPPMVAYLIHLSQSIFQFFFGSDYEGSKASLLLSFRWLPSLLGYVVLPCLVGASVHEFQKKPLTMSQVFALLSAPLIVFGAQLVTPDLPLIVVWAAALLLSLRLKRKLRYNLKAGMITPFSWHFSLWMGILWSLGAYSKYTAVFLPLLFVLSGAGFWNTFIAGILCTSLSSPYIYWTLSEALPQKMGIFYQLDRGTNTANTEVHLNWVADMWAAQLLFWSPVFTLDYLISFKAKRKLSWSMGAWIFLPILFFSITGLRNRPEANWPAMGGIALMVFILAMHVRHPIRLFWFTCINYSFVILALWGMLNQNTLGKLIVPFAPTLGEKLQNHVSRIEEFQGWENLRGLLFASTLIDNDPILVEKYHVLSPLIFYDQIAKKDERLAGRLKIDYIPGKSVCQYHFEQDYLPQPSENYWLFKKGESLLRDRKCSLRLSFVKADPKGEPFSLYKCRQ